MRSWSLSKWPLVGKTRVCAPGLINIDTSETEVLPFTSDRFRLSHGPFFLARPALSS